MTMWKANKKQPSPDVVQISDKDGIVLIAEVYGAKCRDRAKLVAAAPAMRVTLQYIASRKPLSDDPMELRSILAQIQDDARAAIPQIDGEI